MELAVASERALLQGCSYMSQVGCKRLVNMEPDEPRGSPSVFEERRKEILLRHSYRSTG